MYKTILVPVDQSRFSEMALPYAVAVARQTGAVLQLCLVHAAIPAATKRGTTTVVQLAMDAGLADDERQYLERLALRLARQHGIESSIKLLTGHVASALEAYVAECSVDLVVMSTHGRGGLRRAWLGSVADRLVRHLAVPLLLVRPGEGPHSAPFRNVLAALDGTGIAEGALEAIRPLCAPDAAVTIVRVVVPPFPLAPSYSAPPAKLIREEVEREQVEASTYANALLQRTQPAWPQSSVKIAISHQPADAILEAAAGKADVIVVGTHSRTPVSRALLGSVADKVIRGADAPVFVFPAHAYAASVDPEFALEGATVA